MPASALTTDMPANEIIFSRSREDGEQGKVDQKAPDAEAATIRDDTQKTEIVTIAMRLEQIAFD